MAADEFDLSAHDAFLFDLDGVLTPTVELHMRAWAATFDLLFQRVGAPPYREEEYFQSLDGRPRFAGVATLLAARGISLPEGVQGDENLETIIGIGNRKNGMFSEMLERDGIETYPGSLRLLDELRSVGKPCAVVSSSRNAEAVLRAAGLRDRFVAVVDGVVAHEEGIAGKPAPDTYLRAADLVGVSPAASVVFEDAASGVAAGHAGDFGLVVGVDRGAGEAALRQAGAHIVVDDLERLLP